MKNTNTIGPQQRYVQPPTNTDGVCLCQLVSFSSIMTSTQKIVQPVGNSQDQKLCSRVLLNYYYYIDILGGGGCSRAGQGKTRVYAAFNCDQTDSVRIITYFYVHIHVYYTSSHSHHPIQSLIPAFRICTDNIGLCRTISSYRFHNGLVRMVNEKNARWWRAADCTWYQSIEKGQYIDSGLAYSRLSFQRTKTSTNICK